MIYQNILKLTLSAILSTTIISCASTGINKKFNHYKTPENGILLEISFVQEQLRVRNPDSLHYNAGFTGFIPLLISLDRASLNYDRQKELVSISNNLTKFDFNLSLEDKIKNKMENIDWLKLNKSQKLANLDKNEKPLGTHLLEFKAKYELTPMLDSLEVTVFVELSKVTSTRTQRRKPISHYKTIYENRYKFISPIVTPEIIFNNEDLKYSEQLRNSLISRKYSPREKIQMFSKYLSSDQSNKLKQHLNNAIKEISSMIEHDLVFKKSLVNNDFYDELKPYNQFYWEIDNKNSRMFLEGKSIYNSGNLCSIPVQVETHRCSESKNF